MAFYGTLVAGYYDGGRARAIRYAEYRFVTNYDNMYSTSAPLSFFPFFLSFLLYFFLSLLRSTVRLSLALHACIRVAIDTSKNTLPCMVVKKKVPVRGWKVNDLLASNSSK